MSDRLALGRVGWSNKPFYLPLSMVTQTLGILAKRRVGKTYTAKVMAEEFGANNVPFTVLDPTGAWWGLRHSASGERPGLPVVILGGAHGDVPLERHGGKLVADLIVDHPGFYVLDLEGFDSGAAQDGFVTDFAERLYRRKALKRDPMHLFIDEADSFIPQRPGRDQLRMLGAFENIVRRGGIRGLGTTLISQRAAVVNKNVLTQLDALIVLQVTGPQDQDAIKDWVSRDASPSDTRLLMDSLAALPRGEAWVYRPGEVMARVLIREGKTFNSSATPEMGATVKVPKGAAKVDLDAVRAAMAATIAEAEANDPAKLRARIKTLEGELAKRPTETVTVEKVVERVVEVPVMDDELWETLVKAWTSISEVGGRIDEVGARVMAAVTMARTPEPTPPVRMVGHITERRQAEPVLIEAQADTADGLALRAGARKMLDVLVRHHPLRLTMGQWATLAGMTKTGGTWRNYLGSLRKAGLINETSAGFGPTLEGLAHVGAVGKGPMTTAEVRETWRGTLRAGARSMLDALINVYPSGITRDELGGLIGMEPSGGTFRNYIGTLKRNGLVEGDGVLTASPTIMGVAS